MTEEEGGKRLHEAIRAALETASQAGRLRGSTRGALEATLVRLDEKLGASEATELRFKVESVRNQCLVMVHTSDLGAVDVVSSFMHRAGAKKLGSAKAWTIPLGEVSVTRWVRALQRVLSAERRSHGEEAPSLPFRLTAVWAHDDELVIADVG